MTNYRHHPKNRVADDSQMASGVRRWAIDKITAKALWDLSERLTDIKWPK
jgi:hypothetical protein